MKVLLISLSLFMSSVVLAQLPSIKGAWSAEKDGIKTIRIYTDNFFSVASFEATKFVGTYGGTYVLKSDRIVETIEFDSRDTARIGTQVETEYQWRAQESEVNFGEKGNGERFVRLDVDGPGKLAGAWLITGRYSDGYMNRIIPGVRRTVKILSGTRFQWIAYNIETKEFFGTGGGTYTTLGNYTENIDFFSRDQSRVGLSLSFNFSITTLGDWRHSGYSSKGEPIDEVWSKREKLGM